MSSGLITPGLVLEVVEAGEDLVITSEEFSGIIETIKGTVMWGLAFGFLGLVIGAITKEVAR